MRVAVISSQRVLGLNHLEDPPEGLEATTLYPSLGEALEAHHETDAHFLLYGPKPGDDGPAFYRCNKPVLAEVRAAGSDLVGELIAIDYDTPGHEAWTAASWDAFAVLLDVAEGKGFARLKQFAAFYLTSRGARWIFRLSHPVPVDQLEGLIGGLIAEFRAAGIPVDDSPAVRSWNQPFRLPFVTRDGVGKTWELPWTSY